jgi:Carboxypeptidase regulatory-like domain
MEGVVVTARKNGSIVSVSVTSDARGHYAFPESRLEPGEYKISIRAVGYEISAPTTAEIVAEKTATADIRLKKTRNMAISSSRPTSGARWRWPDRRPPPLARMIRYSVTGSGWADPSTLDFLRGIAERGALAPLLVLITARPEFRQPWGVRSHHGTISLVPLDRHQVRDMVSALAARHALLNEMVESVTERTGGVPLFVDELLVSIKSELTRLGPLIDLEAIREPPGSRTEGGLPRRGRSSSATRGSSRADAHLTNEPTPCPSSCCACGGRWRWFSARRAAPGPAIGSGAWPAPLALFGAEGFPDNGPGPGTWAAALQAAPRPFAYRPLPWAHARLAHRAFGVQAWPWRQSSWRAI